jgi:dipicolinate synthase subunit B
MDISSVRIGFALTGSFCTLRVVIDTLCRLKERGFDILPIMSDNVYNIDTRFGKASDLIRQVEEITGNKVVHTIVEAEPLGPKITLDALIISPCTGNTLAKIARGITDTAVTMAAKAHLRQDRPLLIALATNDGMSQNLGNVGRLLMRKSVYFLPMRQDDPEKKPHSLVADFKLIEEALLQAMSGKQIPKMFI